jgi:hypothetical protein
MHLVLERVGHLLVHRRGVHRVEDVDSVDRDLEELLRGGAIRLGGLQGLVRSGIGHRLLQAVLWLLHPDPSLQRVVEVLMPAELMPRGAQAAQPGHQLMMVPAPRRRRLPPAAAAGLEEVMVIGAIGLQLTRGRCQHPMLCCDPRQRRPDERAIALGFIVGP